MGEYFTYKGQQIKGGTCESLYYLRAEHAPLVQPDPRTVEVYRYRFPFPDEDGMRPGECPGEDYDRGEPIPGYVLPDDYADGHGSIQFRHDLGYLVSLPCPESHGRPGSVATPDGASPTIHRNGWNRKAGPVVKAQRLIDGRLVLVIGCGCCGAMWRIDDPAEVERIARAYESEAERTEWRRSTNDWDDTRGCWNEGAGEYAWEPAHGENQRTFLREMAARVRACAPVTVEA